MLHSGGRAGGRAKVTLFLVWLNALSTYALAGKTCVETLVDSDVDNDERLTEAEFGGFLKAEASKGGRGSSTEFKVENIDTADISHFFKMFATDGSAVDIHGTSAALTNRDTLPLQERAFLELLCERSEAFIIQRSTSKTLQLANNPFLEEKKVRSPTNRQDFDWNKVTLNFGAPFTVAMASKLCPLKWQSFFGCMVAKCPQFAEVCPYSINSLEEETKETGHNSSVAEVPTCEKIESGVCKFVEGPEENPNECCLGNCLEQVQSLVACLVMESTGEDHSKCALPDCNLINEDDTDEEDTDEVMDFDLDTFEFNFGVPFTPAMASEFCPSPWQSLIGCVVAACPQFVEACPNSVTHVEETMTLTDNSSGMEAPTCEEIGTDVCKFTECSNQHPRSDCCLGKCLEETHSLAVCMVLETTGEDRSDCALPHAEEDTDEVNTDFDLSKLALNFGAPFTLAMASELCPLEWQFFVGCLIADCPQFAEVCPNSIGNLEETKDISHNSSVTEIPTCEEIENGVCKFMEGPEEIPFDCCLLECLDRTQNLAVCLVSETTGEDYSDCALAPGPACANSIGDEASADNSNAVDFSDFLDLEFDLLGMTVTPSGLQEECPDQWSQVVGCVIGFCPNFLDACPDGLVAATGVPNIATINLTITVAECSGFVNSVCKALTYPGGCCLSDCKKEMYDLTVCAVLVTTGEDLTECNIAGSCVGPASEENDNGVGLSGMPDMGSAVWVNSSFLMSNLQGITASKLKEQLRDGDISLEMLQTAFQIFVQSVVDIAFGVSTDRRRIEQVSGPRMLASKYDPESTRIYDFADTPCNNLTAVSRQGGSRTCIATFGKFKIDLGPEEEPVNVYEAFLDATQSSISDGKLQETLASISTETNATNLFLVEGVSLRVDEEFDPFSSVLDSSSSAGKDDGQVLPSTSPPTNGTNITRLPSQETNTTDDQSIALSSRLVSPAVFFPGLLAYLAVL